MTNAAPDVVAYLDQVREAQTANPDWRLGQTHFNVLYDMRPELARQVNGSLLDPFYRDDRVGGFLDWLGMAW